MENFSCWLNIFKPENISSAKVVSILKRNFKNCKIGHAGTLDVEASGVLPIGIGEATKLMKFLVDAKKVYLFTIKFGNKTDSGDASGNIIASSDKFPTFEECKNITQKFIGQINQIPNSFSAIKVNGVRSYSLARKGKAVELSSRQITIYDLALVDFDNQTSTATYTTTCSKGTYIRTLAEDIALALQSLGFVLKLKRLRVGIFEEINSTNILELDKKSLSEKEIFFENNKIAIDAILDDILVLEASDLQARQIKFGQECNFMHVDAPNIRINYKGILLAIGSLKDNFFNSARVFNLI